MMRGIVDHVESTPLTKKMIRDTNQQSQSKIGGKTMPVYELKCGHCKSYYSVHARMSEASQLPGSECPFCGSYDTERVFSNIGIGARNGASPFRFSTGQVHRGTRRVEDPGFNREYEAIWKESGMEHPDPKDVDPEYAKRRAESQERMIEHAKELKKSGHGGLSGNLKRLQDEGKA